MGRAVHHHLHEESMEFTAVTGGGRSRNWSDGCVPDPVGPVTCGSSVQTRRRLGCRSGSFDPSSYGVEDPRSSAGVVGSWVTSFRSSIIRRTTPMSGYDSLPRSGLLEQP